MASRTLVRRSLRNGAALPQEQPITETMPAPMATWISTPTTIVMIGTMKMPLAMPSAPPRALAPTEMQNSPREDAASMSAPLRTTMGTAPRQPRLEANMVASIVQPLVIDRAMTQRVRGPINQEDRAAARNLQRCRDGRSGGRGFQLVFGFDQRRVVSLLQQGEDGLRRKVVGHDLATEVFRQVCLVEGKRHTVRKADTPNLHHWRSRRERKPVRNQAVGRDNVPTDHAGCRGAAQCPHVL